MEILLVEQEGYKKHDEQWQKFRTGFTFHHFLLYLKHVGTFQERVLLRKIGDK